jgi:hypothetical protein
MGAILAFLARVGSDTAETTFLRSTILTFPLPALEKPRIAPNFPILEHGKQF